MGEETNKPAQLPDRYAPQDVEDKVYRWWEENGFFKAHDVSTKPPFTIIMPPPNVTGSLHIGHALDGAIQDCLVRWKRMSGFNALWVPGTDHAGISTQGVVEKQLAKEGVSRHDLGRDEFVKRVWEWKQQYGDRIVNQQRRMASSCDWDRHVFTLDSSVSEAVKIVFVDLYKKGLIYRGSRLVNWSPKLESAISDLEVNHKDVKGHLWHIKYPIADSNEHLIVATTRPETLLGDTAVAVHPEDDRYKNLVGKEVLLPLTQRRIKIIADKHVDKDFGSGAVKITPAHDFNDYEMGQRHKLEMINILNPNGTLNSEAGPSYEGLSALKARDKVVEDLGKQNLIHKIDPHSHQVGHCDRTGCVIEPLLSAQWFLKMDKLSIPALRVVENGTISFEPESATKTYLNWLSNIQDWCVSRQLWWGHQIPAFHCGNCDHITVEETTPTECGSCKSSNIVQSEDVLDTWFSSALWPFSTLGWPDNTEALKTFYPTDVLVTGHDIIFFWVARMIIMGLEFTGDVPFRKVYLHGLVRDAEGFKMSKSRPEFSVDPLDVIETSGADALRFTLLSQIGTGKDLRFSKQRLEGYRNFMNKIWNAARFSLGVLEDLEVIPEDKVRLPSKADLSDADLWIIYRLGQVEKDLDQALKSFRFSEAAQKIYDFIWHEFCDWYLEFIKPTVYGDDLTERKASQLVLAQTLNRCLRLLHPFAPCITEEIYQKIPVRGQSVMMSQYPTPETDKEFLALGSEEIAFEVDLVREVISTIRNIRGENLIKPGVKINAILSPYGDRGQKILGANKDSIVRMAGLENCDIKTPDSLSKCTLAPIRFKDLRIDVVIPLEGLVNIDEEIQRINKVIGKLKKEALGLERQLENKNFVQNAPKEIIDKGTSKLKETKEKIQSLQESLDRLAN